MNITYYNLISGFRTYDIDNETFKTVSKFTKNVCKFSAFIGYDASDEGLVNFTKDFLQWCKELNTPVKGYLKIDYLSYRSHAIAVESTFKRISGIHSEHETVDRLENSYMSKCNNGGLLYCEEYEGPAFGYDYKSYYPTILSTHTLYIPTKRGRERYVDIKDYLKKGKTLPYGYYYVNIISSNPDANKIFNFSPHGVYTHYSIEFAYKHKKEFGFKFGFYTEEEGYNAYTYNANDLVKSSTMFLKWKTALLKLRELYPKNKLIKHLLSSIWGSLTKYKKICKTYEEIVNEGLNIGVDEDADYIVHSRENSECSDHYILYKSDDPYYYGLARLKSFMTSFARNRLAETAIYGGIDDVIRLHTDNVTFKTNKDDLMKNRKIEPEEKTTGNLKFTVVNRAPTRI